eukprot:scaffold2529_cov147-Amphora_coffeaeformis.AAC.1
MSNHRRLADMDRNKFENYMMTEWRKPKAPPQSQDPQDVASAGLQPDVGIGNQPKMAASLHAATRQAGTRDTGTINIPPPAGPQSRRASLAESRRKSKIGTQSGLTPRKNVTFNVGGLPPTQAARQGTFSQGSNLFGTQTGTPTPQGTNPRSGSSTATGTQLAGYTPHGAPIYVNVPSHGGTKHSKAEEFAKGSRRSVSDYTAFSNREGWSKWQRALLGTALDHKTEKVLDYTYIPDPNDTDACELFDSQKRFMYSVFTKTITEPSAVDILRNYSNPNSPDFGDAQQIYADLCDHFEGGAIGQVTIMELETQLTTLHLNKSWTKSVSHFVHFVAGKIKDHKDLTNSNHDDHYYVEKLNATFEEHKDMSAHIQTLKSQRSMLEHNGITLQPISYESQLFELKQHATTLDHRYKKNQSSRNAHEASS